MKHNGATSAFLGPDAHGWRVSVGGGEEQSVATLGEAVATLPAHANVELALPCQSVLIERHKLDPALCRYIGKDEPADRTFARVLGFTHVPQERFA